MYRYVVAIKIENSGIKIMVDLNSVRPLSSLIIFCASCVPLHYHDLHKWFILLTT